jgi:hypothetical protein
MFVMIFFDFHLEQGFFSSSPKSRDIIISLTAADQYAAFRQTQICVAECFG